MTKPAVDSPFDFRRHGLLYVPRLPRPNAEAWPDAVVERAGERGPHGVGAGGEAQRTERGWRGDLPEDAETPAELKEKFNAWRSLLNLAKAPKAKASAKKAKPSAKKAKAKKAKSARKSSRKGKK